MKHPGLGLVAERIPPPENALINHIAIRSFRDTGDGDYITARLAMRSRLSANFLWSAQQAVEKYLKCILMLNRRNTSDLSHNLNNALDRINADLAFKIVLGKAEQEFFDHLNNWGGDRYLLYSFELHGHELFSLDLLVWRLRQYCVPLDLVHYADAPSTEVLLKNVAAIEAGWKGPSKNGHVSGALLETILANKAHAARAALVWKNARYSNKVLKKIPYTDSFQAINAPLFNDPELVDKVSAYMRIPRDVLEGARQLAEERRQNRDNE